jgi:hypothetical protein
VTRSQLIDEHAHLPPGQTCGVGEARGSRTVFRVDAGGFR